MSCFLLLVLLRFSNILVLFSSPGQGLLSQSALQLNNQDSYAAAGYHNSQGLESVAGRHGQVGGAVHIYNQVNVHGRKRMTSTPCVSSRVWTRHEVLSFLHEQFHPETTLDCGLSQLGNMN